MTKIALLVGVSDYDSGLAPLHGTLTDIEAMNRVLAAKDIGAFDQVKSLPNPDFSTLQREVEILFTEDRHEDDLVVLYFSGHGLKDKDENGALYFAARDTQFTTQRQLRTYSAVSAQFIQQCMNRSRSKRLVFILDCCFSGAFAKDWKMKAAEMPVNLEAQLGGEGRAVLTSSTSTQLSYEDQGASIYTRYLVQGIETGAADRDEDGWITTDELHQYAKEKVQKEAPAMCPEIYPVREGYTIRFVKAPLGDPKLAYRKEVEALAKLKNGNLNVVDLATLEHVWQKKWHLPETEAKQIEDQVLQPYREFQQHCGKFEQVLQQALQDTPTLTRDLVESLRYYQQKLKLRDEDIAPIMQQYQVDLKTLEAKLSQHNEPDSSNESDDSKAKLTRRTFLVVAGVGGLGAIASVALGKREPESSISVALGKPEPEPSEPSNVQPDPLATDPSPLDYSTLEKLLQEKNFKGADAETLKLMLKAANNREAEGWRSKGAAVAANREAEGWLNLASLSSFPCDVLSKIDELWVKYSNGKFGFSVQQKIWQEVGSPTEYNEQWETFGDRVGWRKNGINWIAYSEATFDTTAPPGHLPVWVGFAPSGHLPVFCVAPSGRLTSGIILAVLGSGLGGFIFGGGAMVLISEDGEGFWGILAGVLFFISIFAALFVTVWGFFVWGWV